MQKMVRVELKDGLGFPSGFVSPADYVCVMYYKLPEDWLNGDQLLADKKEAMLEAMYGRTWRMGNDDGSRYVVFSFDERVLSSQEEQERAWLQNNPKDKDFKYWYYHLSENGIFKSVKQDEF
jgi:hypothetical protein